MCLGIPGKIIEIYETHGVNMGKVDFEGVTKEICLAYVPEAEIGDYAIVHVGFAITKVDEASAQETLKMLRELGILEEELCVDAVASDLPISSAITEASSTLIEH